MKKHLSIFVTLALVMSLVMTISFTVLAEPATYTGSEGEGYLITTAEEFQWLNGHRDVTAYLAADIQLGTPESPLTNNVLGGWQGKLIGLDEDDLYTITLYMNKSGTYAGLISAAQGTIKNISIAGEIKGADSFVGAFAGAFWGGVYENIENHASVSTTVSNKEIVGGIVGKIEKNAATIANARNYGTVFSAKNNAGGIAGQMAIGTIVNSANFGDVSVGSGFGYAAGIAGQINGGAIYNTYNSGNITAGYYPGGIAGVPMSYNNPVILNCFNTGTITSTSSYSSYSSAGILATALGNTFKVYGCYNVGKLVNNAGKRYPIVGSQTNGTVTNADMKQNRYIVNSTSYTGNNGATEYSSVLSEDVAGWALTSDNISAVSSNVLSEYPLSGWTIDTTTGFSYPQLITNPYRVMQNGTSEFPYIVASKEDFMKIASNKTAYYKLVSDINLGSYTPFDFSGSLVAESLTTITVDINEPLKDNIGLFTELINAIEIKNIKVAGSVVGNNNVGGIAGRISHAPSAAFSTGIINNCCNSASVYANGNYGGGIVGYVNLTVNTYEVTTLSDCSNTGAVSVTGYGAGGIAGISIVNRSAFLRCSNSGAVTGTSQTAGIAGYFSGNANYCTNTGVISGTSRVAGIIGHQAGRGANYCYNMGEIHGKGDSVAGIIGFATGAASIQLSYNGGNIYGIDTLNAVGTLMGTSGGNWANNVRNSYNVGTVYTNSTIAPLNALVGKQESVAPNIDNSYSLDLQSGDYKKNLVEMKAFIPTSVFEASTTDYPFAQIKGTPVNNADIDIYTVTVSKSGEGEISISGTKYVNNMGDFVLRMVPEEGYSFNSVTVDGTAAEFTENNGKYNLTLSNISSNKTIVVNFTENIVVDAEDIQDAVDAYNVTYFRPIILNNETITSQNGEFELIAGTNYAIIMSRAETFEGYELVDYGVKTGNDFLSAKPYITEDEYGTLLYGNRIYSGNTVVFRPYIKLKNIYTLEETTFIGNETAITLY